MNQKNALMVAAISGSIAVAAGALGAHLLEDMLTDEMLSVYKTGNLYHLFHSIVLLALAIGPLYHSKKFQWSFWFIALGIKLFSGSLYLISLLTISGESAPNWLGPLTPLGGICFIVGWLFPAFYKK